MLVVTDRVEDDVRARLTRSNVASELKRIVDRLAIEFHDDVSRLDPSFRRGPVLLDVGDEGTLGRVQA